MIQKDPLSKDIQLKAAKSNPRREFQRSRFAVPKKDFAFLFEAL